MLPELILVVIQFIGIPLNLYYKQNISLSFKQFIITIFTMCIYIPIIEEILFRYAFYHLLENYLNNIFYINLINGVVFGLTHIFNIFIIKFPNMIVFSFHVTSNMYLGYYLATHHNNLLYCMIVHILYNLCGYSIKFICNKILYDAEKPDELINRKIFVSKPKLRRSNSLSSIPSEFISIPKYKISNNVLNSINNYDIVTDIMLEKFNGKN